MKINLNNIVYSYKETTMIPDHHRPVPHITWLEIDGSTHHLFYDDDGPAYEGHHTDLLAIQEFSDYMTMVNKIARHKPNISADFILQHVVKSAEPSNMFIFMKQGDTLYPFQFVNDDHYDWYKPELRVQWNAHDEHFTFHFYNMDDAVDYWEDFLHLSPAEIVWMTHCMKTLEQLHHHQLIHQNMKLTYDMVEWFQQHTLTSEDSTLIQALGLDEWYHAKITPVPLYSEVPLFS